jgi:hypothetical protein
MSGPSRDDTAKEPYQTPRLRVVDLAADEVLAIGCKLSTGAAGPVVGNTGCVSPSPCFSPGS